MKQKTNSLPNYIKLNPAIRPQDDFYAYVCHHWQQTNPRPATHSRWGNFSAQSERVKKQLEQILAAWLKTDESKLEPEQRQAIRCYQALADSPKHCQRSLQTFKELLDELKKIPAGGRQKAGLISWAAEQGFYTFFDLDVAIDSKNNQRFCLMFDSSDLDLPDRDYYINQSKKLKAFRKAYLDFVAAYGQELERLGCGFELQPEKILEIETTLAELNWPRHKTRDTKKTYNPYTWADFCQKFKFDWRAYFKAHQAAPPTDLLVSQPSYLRGSLLYLRKLSEADVRMYIGYKITLQLGTMVDDALLKTSFDFFGKILSGTTRLKPRRQRAARAAGSWFSDTFGQVYVARHFSAESKEELETMAKEIADAFARRLKNNSWMSEESKDYAQDKLSRIIVNIGYSDDWEKYDVRLKADNPVANHLCLMESFKRKKLALLEKTPDRRRFDDLDNNVQAVNAWTNLVLLNTNYPAAFLQPPFYDPKASFEYNLGALGSVIGHELTHNFDDQGSHYDIDGHLNTWLGKEEQKAFKKAAAKLIKHASRHQPVPKIHMKGKQVIGELIADLGGLEIVVDIVRQKYTDKKARKEALKRLFIAHAFYYAENDSAESKIMLAKAGVHPDDPFRVNGVLAHCSAFYEAFNLKKGDNLYLKPRERAVIW